MKFLTTFLFLLAAYTLIAAPVTMNDAAKFSVNFYKHQYSRIYKSVPEKTIQDNYTLYYDGVPTMFVFMFSGGGYVIVSAENSTFPVIAYSFDEEFSKGNLPPAMTGWCSRYSKQIHDIVLSQKKSPAHPLWEKFANDVKGVSQEYIQTVGPLITTRWGQGNPYYLYCPVHPGYNQHCVTGCVATAMGQVMKYWNYPETGEGSHSFYWDSLYTCNFGETTYRWTEMTNTATSTSKYAIAELLYHCGVSVDMSYGVNESGTFSFFIPDALRNYFKYHPSVRHIYRNDYADTTWDVIIRDNLDMLRPMVYSGSGPQGGHAWVCDGYQDTCFYHMNWGWDGGSNGYYYYNDLTPGGYDFSYDESAVVNIFPYFGDYCRQGRQLNEQIRSFDDGSGTSKYWNNSDCDWLIKPEGVENISISFSAFNTENGKDILYIYDGEDATAPLLGQFSGTQTPAPLTTTGPAAYIRFVSDGANQYDGWEIYYTSTLPQNVNFQGTDIRTSIFPNPATDRITVSSNNTITGIEIKNISGITVFKNIYSDGNTVTLYNKYSPGIYFVTIRTEKGISVAKLVIE